MPYEATPYGSHYVVTTNAPKMFDVCPITRCDAGVQSRHQAISQAAGIFTAATIIISQYPPIVMPVTIIIISQSPKSLFARCPNHLNHYPTIITVAVIVNISHILIAEKPFELSISHGSNPFRDNPHSEERLHPIHL